MKTDGNEFGSNVRPGLPGEAIDIVVIERRALMRECLANCFVAALGPVVRSYASVKSWVGQAQLPAELPRIIVLSTAGEHQDSEETQTAIELLASLDSPPTLIMLADAEEQDRIVHALRQGARGYIPTSSSLQIAIEAIRLVRAGGIYVPADSLMVAAGRQEDSAPAAASASPVQLTHQQHQVLNALRKGKANKAIAHELSIHESTVKVHVRNIMKKLGARNRTQIVYLARTQVSQLK